MSFRRRQLLAGLVLGAAVPALWAGAYEDFFVAILRDDADAITACMVRNRHLLCPRCRAALGTGKKRPRPR